ncbi:hypothetical protein KX729_25430 [Rhizobium sp. XQZ8]|uniref:hypothetical protein n=1 Tax=Rhizobium populisoli TaxID=2859785 RepID=UPI001CA55B62|nr:hypothetical protein [Rhizobium populisoli]MBW6424798.1 hypothetical protein [Rhizobium populisoli]
MRDRNIPFAPSPGEFFALFEAKGQKQLFPELASPAGFKLLGKVTPLMRQLSMLSLRRLIFFPSILVNHTKSFLARYMADVLGLPHVLVSPLPGCTPYPLLPLPSLGPLNRFSRMLATHRLGFCSEARCDDSHRVQSV